MIPPRVVPMRFALLSRSVIFGRKLNLGSCITNLGLDRMVLVNDTPEFLLRLAELFQQIYAPIIKLLEYKDGL